jgi:tRNA A64-2'-O-ribosylphosphate transferase
MPDALTKTIPIWCVVINRLLFENTPTAHQLFTPKSVVGPSEHAQIEARLETLIEDAKVITNFDIYRNIFLADLLVSAS